MAKNPILALLILVLAKGPHCLPFQADGTVCSPIGSCILTDSTDS